MFRALEAEANCRQKLTNEALWKGRWFETVGSKPSSYLAAAESGYCRADGALKKKNVNGWRDKKSYGKIQPIQVSSSYTIDSETNQINWCA